MPHTRGNKVKRNKSSQWNILFNLNDLKQITFLNCHLAVTLTHFLTIYKSSWFTLKGKITTTAQGEERWKKKYDVNRL